MAKNKKTALPNKKTMNLYQPTRKDNPVVVSIIGIVLALAIVGAMAAFVVLPKYNEIQQQKLINADLEDTLTLYQSKLKNYNKVKEEFYRYSDAIEAGGVKLVDRVKIIEIVTECIKDLGTVPAIDVSENTVSLNFESKSSALVADFVDKLEKNEYVTKVQVFYSNMGENRVISSVSFVVAEPEVK